MRTEKIYRSSLAFSSLRWIHFRVGATTTRYRTKIIIRYQSPADTIPDIGSPVTAIDAKKATTRSIQKRLMPVGDAGHQGESGARALWEETGNPCGTSSTNFSVWVGADCCGCPVAGTTEASGKTSAVSI